MKKDLRLRVSGLCFLCVCQYASTCTPSAFGNAGRLLHDAAVLSSVLLRIECLDGLGLLHLVLAEDELDAVAEELNDRPRKTLGFMKPSEKIIELLDAA